MRRRHLTLLASLLLSATACGGDARCAAGTEAVGGQCRAIVEDAGQDTTKDPVKGLDGSTPSERPDPTNEPDASPTPPRNEVDAGRDAAMAPQRDAATSDAGKPSDAGALDACVATREVCNGLDDDCDGEVDNGVLQFFYVDEDGDGFGGTQGVLACGTAPDGHTKEPGDCDDKCKTCHMGAPELCDGKDNDCDTLVDEDQLTPYYRDMDGDGFGAGNARMDCAPPAGFVSPSGDCDDNCPTCNPGQPDDKTCDSKDDDCSGTVDEDATFVTYYKDCDEDGYAPSATGSVLRCARPAAVGGCGWATRNPTSVTTTDCKDDNASVKPGQTEFKRDKIPGAAASKDFDYNCDGREEKEPLLNECSPCREGCFSYYRSSWDTRPAPECGERYDIVEMLDDQCNYRSNPIWPTYPQNCR